MKYGKLYNNDEIQKIGFGTWRIGGGGESASKSLDTRSLAALRSALEIGYTHFDTAEMYASGHSEELIGQAVTESKIACEKLFITSKVLPAHLNYKDVISACENSLKRLKMDYLDMYLIHWPSANMDLEGAFRALNQLAAEKKVRHIGVSNFDVALIKKAQALSEKPIATNQVPYSISNRAYVRNGMLNYCAENNILLTAYSPVDEGKLKINKSLKEIAVAHGATAYQIALAWLIQQPRVIAIPMSFDAGHQRENFEAAQIELSSAEMETLNALT